MEELCSLFFLNICNVISLVYRNAWISANFLEYFFFQFTVFHFKSTWGQNYLLVIYIYIYALLPA